MSYMIWCVQGIKNNVEVNVGHVKNSQKVQQESQIAWGCKTD